MKNLMILLSILTLSCCNGREESSATPKKYLYTNDLTKIDYQSDTTSIRTALNKMMSNQIKPFNKKTYDSGTALFIDSLVYGPDPRRMVVFIIAKNSTMKLLQRENDSSFYYGAFFLFCTRESLDAPISVYDYSGYRLNLFYDYTEIKEALREYCFNRMMRKEATQQYYNINDVRFWNSKYVESIFKTYLSTSSQSVERP